MKPWTRLDGADFPTRAKVGWPDFALASTTNFPMSAVTPITRTLLFLAIAVEEEGVFHGGVAVLFPPSLRGLC